MGAHGIKEKGKALAKSACRSILKAASACRIFPRDIVLAMDGGICSQMHFYLVGEILRRRGNNVTFDCRWYDICGKDLDGRFSRNFDLLKMFPRLTFRRADEGPAMRLRRSLLHYHNEYFGESDPFAWTRLRGPIYADGYFRDPEEMYARLFRETFRADCSLLEGNDRILLGRIERAEADGGACAVHVRRGDLSQYIEAYGDPLSPEYFRNAIGKIREQKPGAVFYIFSDEPDWCRGNILPLLPDVEAEICGGNGSDRGWCDLLLMSQCSHIVTSQGSMGRYAAMLRPDTKQDGIVAFPDTDHSEEWLPRFRNTIRVGTAPDSRG